MSIFPKKLIKGKDDFTTFHMRICNNSDEDIIGQIKYKVILPDGNSIEMDIDRTEKVEANSELNEYDNFYIKAEYPIGRYFVEGRFIWEWISYQILIRMIFLMLLLKRENEHEKN